MASSPITSQQIERKKVEAVVTDFLFWTLKSLQIVTAAIQLEENYFLAGKVYKHRQCFKKQRNHFADKGSHCQGYGPSNSHAWMWALDHKEGKVQKNWCFWTVVVEKTLESLLDNKEIKTVNLKRNQPWTFLLEGLMLKLKLQYFSHLMQRADSMEKSLRLQDVKGRRRSGWQRMKWLDSITNSMDMNLGKLGDGEGQGSLASCSPWGHEESDTTWQPNNNKKSAHFAFVFDLQLCSFLVSKAKLLPLLQYKHEISMWYWYQ